MKPPPLDNSFPFPRPKINISAKWLLLAPLGIFVVVGLFSSYYTVSSESEAVVQRFGKFKEIAKPGLHFKIPYGVDTATILPVRRQLKLEFGFNTPGATSPDQFSQEPDKERDMVAGDR